MKTRIFAVFAIVISMVLVGGILYRHAPFAENDTTVSAESTSCTDEMSDSECLAYLQEQAKSLREQREALQADIDKENATMQSIYEQLAYYNKVINESEISIQQLETEIQAKTLEVKILNEEVKEIQSRVDGEVQEVELLQKRVAESIAETYKLIDYSEIDILLTSDSMRDYSLRTKYLEKARLRDEANLASIYDKVTALKNDKELLAAKLDLVAQRTAEIEAEREELLITQADLKKQKNEQAMRLAQSREKINNYWGELEDLKQQEDKITATITRLIFEQHNSGTLPANTPVKKGDIIGYQGYSGFTYGAHLHFALYGKDPFALGYLTGGRVGQPVGAGTAAAPLDGGVMTQSFHSGYAIDIVSTTSGIQDASATYNAPKICCYGMCRTAGVYSARGTGAPVRAIKDGRVSALHVDACGGRYVIVDHGNGEVSLYLHLN